MGRRDSNLRKDIGHWERGILRSGECFLFIRNCWGSVCCKLHCAASLLHACLQCLGYRMALYVSDCNCHRVSKLLFSQRVVQCDLGVGSTYRAWQVVRMKIRLSPQRRDDTLEVIRSGSTLIVNGESFDFSVMGDGDTLPMAAVQSEWFVGDIEKVGGELSLTLLLPLPPNFSQEQAFPADLVDVPNGPVVFPQPLPEVLPKTLSEDLE